VTAQVPTVTAAAVPDDAALLDVREDDEWQAGHAPGAQHVRLGELVARVEEVPRDRDVVVVCRSGGRSAQATAYLVQLGVRAVNLDGGMQAWAAAGRPMTSETGGPAAVV